MKIRCCALCSDNDGVIEITEINKSDLYFCDNCGFISFEDTICIEVEDEK